MAETAPEAASTRMARVRAIVARLRSRHEWLDHLARASARYHERHGNHFAAAVTFFTVLAAVPLLMIAFAAAGYVLFFSKSLLAELEAALAAALPDGFVGRGPARHRGGGRAAQRRRGVRSARGALDGNLVDVEPARGRLRPVGDAAGEPGVLPAAPAGRRGAGRPLGRGDRLIGDHGDRDTVQHGAPAARRPRRRRRRPCPARSRPLACCSACSPTG